MSILFIISLMLLCSHNALAYDADYDDGNLQYSILDNSTVAVYSLSYYYGGSSSVQIPSHINIRDKEYKVVKILSMGYGSSGASKIRKISLPNTIVDIGQQSIMLPNLETIVLPQSLESIGFGAFYGCKKLTSINIPPMVSHIEERTFYDCEALQSIAFESDSNLRTIDDEAFRGCTSLVNIDLPSSIQQIGESVFYGCSSLRKIVLPHSLNAIGKSAFMCCSRLEEVTVFGLLKTISESCFNWCPKLSKVTLHNGVETIETGAFSGDPDLNNGLTNIANIVLPPSVKSVGLGNFTESNIVIFNGNMSIFSDNSTYFILDNKYPIFKDGGFHRGTYYVYDKDLFLKTGDFIERNVHQLNEDFENISLKYNGFPQGPNRNNLKWSIGKKLKDIGIAFTFNGIENTDCGSWHGAEDVTFSYGELSFTTKIYYDYSILPIPLNIRCNNYIREYGDNNPQFNVLCEGFVANDNLENSFSDFKYNCNASQKSSVGEYEITASGTSRNYIPQFTSGILTIKKSPLIVEVSDAEKTYGSPNPNFAFALKGLKAEDTESTAFTKLPEITTEATEKSDVGTYQLAIIGGTSINYEITDKISGNLIIRKAPLTLSANNAERLYHSENPKFDFTLTGLVNDDDKTCLSKMPDFACAATSASDCGEYDIIPSNAEAKNYDITYSNGTMTVSKSPLSIGVVDVSREYGDPNPQFEFIYSGLKDEDVASALTVMPKAVCSARPNSPVGYYDIEVSGAESDNYEISYTPGILTVKAAPLTIRPKDTTKVFGSENPEFELSYEGFKNNDDESVLLRLPKVNTSANAQSPVGNYPIIASDASARNYAIEYEQGVLSITKNKLTAKVKDTARLYGDDNPQFQIEYSGFLNGDTEDVITTKPQFNTEVNKKSKAGTYAVSATGATSPNYDFEYQDGMLTINPRQISASVGNYTRLYGVENPSFAVSYDGFVNGDDLNSISEPTVANCEANMQSNAGTYPIMLSGGRGENYEVTSFTNGILTVEKADQTIEWNQDLSAVNQYEQIELTATSTSGLPITYEFANNNVIDMFTSGGKTFIDCYGTGIVTIRATQSGNENYNAAETVTNRVTVVSEGGYVDPSSPEIFVEVKTPGTLSSLINASKKYQIKSLTLSGSLNGTDIRYIREMAGRDVNGGKTNGILEKLNLSGATIVSGGDYYYTTNSSSSYSSYRKYTSNNKISDYMFYGCSTLTNLSLPQNSTGIGERAFDGCLNLSNINMPDGIQTIGEYAFNGDISLTRISIPGQTTSIGNYAFKGCSGLTTLILSSSVKTIGNGMLNGCLNIKEITLNSDNPYFSTLNGVLYNKNRTSLIVYPAGKQLQTFEIPDGVIEIKDCGFYGVAELKYLFFPESLSSIGADAFKGCSNLSKLYARPNTPPTCANDCFEAVSKSNCSLYVPRGSYSSYWGVNIWGDFLKIEESNDLSLGGNIAKPDYCFEFPETTLSRGKCTYLPVSMNNVDPVVGFQCDIVLPEGVKLYEDASNQIVFKTSDRFPMSQSIDSRVQANGDVRIICTSTSNEAFNGTEGILFYIPLFITDPNVGQDSEYLLSVKNIEFTRKDQSGYHAVESPDIAVTLSVAEYSLGDANGDGRITGVDAIITKGYFLGDSPANFIIKAADMDFNGKISITDVVLITDEFLSQNQRQTAKRVALSDSHSSLKLVGKHKTPTGFSFDINLPNAYRFTSIQMDITVPEGLDVKNIEVGDDNRSSHNVKYFRHSNGMTRLFIYSDNNDDFISDNILSIEVEGIEGVQGSDEIAVDEVLAVEISGRDYLEMSVDGSVSKISDISDISEITADSQIEIWSENSTLYVKSASDSVINLYDVAGRYRLIEIQAGITSIPLTQGVYLINDKKILIK